MLRIRILEADDRRLRAHLLRGRDADEEAAFLLAAGHDHAEGHDFLVREVLPVPDEALFAKGRAGLEIDPVFISTVVKKARTEELSIFLCHSHPFTDIAVRFSSIDDAGEERLFPRFLAQVPTCAHGAIVFGRESRDARVWLQGRVESVAIDEVVVVGSTVDVVKPTSSCAGRRGLALEGVVARQVLALGEVGNMRVSRMRVGLIGAGGVGSVVFAGAMRIGVAEITVVDGDTLSLSNVSRADGASVSEVGIDKVRVLEHIAEGVGFGTRVRGVSRWLQTEEALASLLQQDVLVVGTDTMKSRVLASRLGMQFLLPVISVGIDIAPGEAETVGAIGGHVAVQYPDGPCLDCLGLIDHELLRREEMSQEARLANAYTRGRDPEAPAPSVFVFNQVVGGLVGIELLQLATGQLRGADQATYLVFDGRTGEVRRVLAKAVRRCDACSQIRGWGDRYRLPLA